MSYPENACFLNKVKWKSFSRVRLFAAPWTVAYQAPLSLEYSRQENKWVAIPFSRGSSQPSDKNLVSCIGSKILYHLIHQGSGSLSEAYEMFENIMKI